MIGSDVIANFSNAVADAKTPEDLQKVGRTYAKDIARAGVRDICADIFTKRLQEIRS